MEKLVTLPTKELKILKDGKDSGERINVFISLLSTIVENVPHMNDTDAFLAHQIHEKIDEAETQKAATIVLTESEILFVTEGLNKLRKAGMIAGSNWYYLISCLRESIPFKKIKESADVVPS